MIESTSGHVEFSAEQAKSESIPQKRYNELKETMPAELTAVEEVMNKIIADKQDSTKARSVDGKKLDPTYLDQEFKKMSDYPAGIDARDVHFVGQVMLTEKGLWQPTTWAEDSIRIREAQADQKRYSGGDDEQ